MSDSFYIKEREGAAHKKVDTESDKAFKLFWEYRKMKANPNFNHVMAYTKMCSTAIESDFCVFF